MNRFTQWLALVRLDLRVFRSDRRALIMLFVVPIGIASFMGSIFGGSPRGPGNRARVPAAMEPWVAEWIW